MANALQWYDTSKVLAPGWEEFGGSPPEWLTQAGNVGLFDPQELARLGYTGSAVGSGANGSYVTPEFERWLVQNGYTITPDPGGFTALTDASGRELARAQGQFDDPWFGGVVDAGVAAVLGTGLMSGLGSGAGAAGSSGAAGSLTGAGALDAYAAMDAAYGAAGLGGGATGAGLAAGGAGLGAGATGGAGVVSGGGGITGTLGGAAGAGGAGSVLPSIGGSVAGGGLSGLIGTGLSTVGNLIAADKAGDAISDATSSANALQRYMYDTTRADNMPALTARNNALTGLQSLLSNPSSITSDPGYSFGLNEGTKALNTGAAARGMTYSGAQQKALQRYGQDYAGTKLNDSFNRLASLAGLGQTGAGTIAGAGSAYANNVGNNTTALGSALASQNLLTGQTVGDAINGLTAYGQRQQWWGG